VVGRGRRLVASSHCGSARRCAIKTLTGPSDELPEFGAVVLTNAVAGTKHHRLDLTRATTTEIVGTSGKDLTKSSTTGNSTAIVIWEGFN
jgi:Peptidase A4 family